VVAFTRTGTSTASASATAPSTATTYCNSSRMSANGLSRICPGSAYYPSYGSISAVRRVPLAAARASGCSIPSVCS
jgi:hypothetical protein